MLINESRTAALMDDAGLDGLVGTRLENVFYLSGLWNASQTIFPFEVQCYAVVARDALRKPIVVTSTGDLDQTLVAFPGIRTVHYGTFYRELPEGIQLREQEQVIKALTIDRAPRKNALDALVAALEEAGLAEKRLGIDETAFDPAYWSELESRLPKLKIERAASLFRKIRMVKTEEEVRRIRRAAQITEQAIRAAVAIAREGVTERAMVQELQHSMISQGAQPRLTLLRFGANTTLGQVPSDDTRLQKGDMIWFDVGCQAAGYWSDIARVFVLGEPSGRLRRYYGAVQLGEERAFKVTRPGMTAAQLFDETVAAVKEGGIGHYRRHHVGHGIGIEIYDMPLIAPGQEITIEEGTVINIEMPYYELGWGAVHVEDPYVVHQNGTEVLTTLDRGLGIIER